MTREDVVKVRMTEAGEESSGGCRRVVGPTYDYEFRPGTMLEMTRAEFDGRLAGDRVGDTAVFEIVVE